MGDNNTSSYDKTIERADFFRNIQIWPLNNVLNYGASLECVEYI
ncbi:hypothetical protein FACS189442_5720 [Spirochaetia bacterium]|nr:hypothetical protein FACS189442_5720 [Spirochaetia bacterium]